MCARFPPNEMMVMMMSVFPSNAVSQRCAAYKYPRKMGLRWLPFHFGGQSVPLTQYTNSEIPFPVLR